MPHNWQQPDWGDFRYDLAKVITGLLAFAEQSGRSAGLMEGLSDELQTETMIDLMIGEALMSSQIEGVNLNRDEVMSSIRNQLGLNVPPLPVQGGLAKGAGELMVAARSTFREEMTAETLFKWHRTLLGETFGIRVGAWRERGDPMQIVSGAVDNPTVHFEAPPAAAVPGEMARFIQWFNDSAPGGRYAIGHPPLRSAIAHLYFESIHPFEDGNGRIGRAIAEKALSQDLGRPALLSLSETIASARNQYYRALKSAQLGNEISGWLEYFVEIVLAAQRDTGTRIAFILK